MHRAVILFLLPDNFNYNKQVTNEGEFGSPFLFLLFQLNLEDCFL